MSDELEWLASREVLGTKLGLDNIRELLSRLGDPQSGFKIIHVAGSDGKGSVCAMIESVLRSAGHRTGRYTSPHLVRVNERISVDGADISDEDLRQAIGEVREASQGMEGGGPTYFECMTAAAFLHFLRSGVEWGVAEVGMGGRLDATNVVEPECSVITRISLEHREHLGPDVAAIAGEKAGIVKPGRPVVTTARQPREALRVIESRASRLGCPIVVAGRDVEYEAGSGEDGSSIHLPDEGLTLRTPLRGRHQADNMAVAYCAVKEVMMRGAYVPDEAIVAGMAATKWPGRLQRVLSRPDVIFDVTHTPAGAEATASELGRVAALVLGVSGDKDVDAIAGTLGGMASVAVAVAAKTERAMPAGRVARALERACPTETAASVAEGIERAIDLAGRDGTVLVTGSLYVIGEAMRWLDGKGRRPHP